MSYHVLTSYKHIQDTPSDVWTIDHNAGGYPCVDVYVMIDEALVKIMPNEISYVSPSTCTISFTSPRTGFAQVS